MLEIFGILLFFSLIVASIALHEIGHLVPAKRFGVRVPEYMVGFGPTLLSWRRGETRYGMKAIPLGGYIRMIGMLPPAPEDPSGQPRSMTTGRVGALIQRAREQALDELEPGDENRLFYRLPPWKRIIIMMGGPTMNLLLAVVLFSIILLGVGLATPKTTVERVMPCIPVSSQTPVTTEECAAGPSAAALVGLEPADRIVSFNGAPVSDWETLSSWIQDSGGQSVTLGFVRGGEELLTEVTVPNVPRPLLDDAGRPTGVFEEVGYLGVQPTFVYERQSVTAIPEVMWEMTARSLEGLVSLPVRLYQLISETLIGGEERSIESPISVVGASRLGGDVVASDEPPQSKAVMFLGLAASINLFLFLFNLIPLLPLDGGHVAGALYESLRRKAYRLIGKKDPGYVDISKMLPVAYGAAALLVVMGSIVIFADLVKPLALV